MISRLAHLGLAEKLKESGADMTTEACEMLKKELESGVMREHASAKQQILALDGSECS